MSVLAMKKLNICAMKKDKRALIEKLQALGVMEIDTSLYKDTPLEGFNTMEDKVNFDRKAVAIDNALNILEEYSEEKKGMLASLEGKRLIGKGDMNNVLKNEVNLFETAKEIGETVKRISESKVNMDRNKVSMEMLQPWSNLDMPMDFTHTKRTTFFIGTIKAVENEKEIYDALGEYVVDLGNIEVQILNKGKRICSIVVVCLQEVEASVENGLHSLEFARISNLYHGLCKDEIQNLEKENVKLAENIEEYKKKLKELNSYKEQLEVLADHYRMMSNQEEATSKILQSEKAVFISGYVVEKAVDKIINQLNQDFKLFVQVIEPESDEQVPVAIQNKGIGRAMGGIVESFGLPGKHEIDPSTIMGIFYVILFGLMLSDAAYGMIIFGACFFLLKKYDRMEESMRTALELFKYCGISTFIWGILFGGFFGDVVTVFSQTFLGKTVTIPALWFAPIEDPMRLLMYSMLFGIIHLFTGLAIKGYMCLRDKEYMNFLCDVVLWFMLLVGLIMLFLPSELFSSLAQVTLNLPAAFTTVGKVLAIVGAVGILLMGGRGKKNPGLRIALGAYDLYNITSWLSDLLSYSRLLALSLATGVIASVFNQMGSMMGDSIIGMIFFIIIFIVGHLFNLGINMLGAYVHTNRLQYVEFFGKFYEGGGKPFNPFRAETKYIDLREETK